MKIPNSVSPENFKVLQVIAATAGPFSCHEIRRSVPDRTIARLSSLFTFYRSRGWLKYADTTIRATRNVKMLRGPNFPDLDKIKVRGIQPLVAPRGYQPRNISPLERRYREFRDAIVTPMDINAAVCISQRS
jgi:hypothetical protein